MSQLNSYTIHASLITTTPKTVTNIHNSHNTSSLISLQSLKSQKTTMATGEGTSVYGNLAPPTSVEEAQQETEEAYVEMSGDLMDTLQKSNSLKKSVEYETNVSSHLVDGYVDIETLVRRKQQKKAGKISSKKNSQTKRSSMSKTKVCATVLMAIILSALISIAVSVATHMLFMHIIHNQDFSGPSLNDWPKFNCSMVLARRCALNHTDSNTYECKTGTIPVEHQFPTTMDIQCVQISDLESSLPMMTSLVFIEESNQVGCICTVRNGSDNNSTLHAQCGIWINECSTNK